jgi:hypothetical protein
MSAILLRQEAASQNLSEEMLSKCVLMMLEVMGALYV